MSTNFADAPAGDAAKGAKIFKTKCVFDADFAGSWMLLIFILYSYVSIGALSAMWQRKAEAISKDQTWEVCSVDRPGRLKDTLTVRPTKTRALSGMRILCTSTC